MQEKSSAQSASKFLLVFIKFFRLEADSGTLICKVVSRLNPLFKAIACHSNLFVCEV